jgi:SAM-dependent methyltransferase
VSLERVREYWERHPVGISDPGRYRTDYDYFRAFDNLREAPDVEPYELSNAIHGYEDAAGKTVLDYGCGNGYVLAHYARNGAAVVGVDATARAVELARRRFALLGLEGTFVQNDGRSIPVESESVDVACSMGVLHHIPEPGPVVAELHRVIRPGGTLIVMVYNRSSFRYRVLFPTLARVGPEPYRGRTLDELVDMNDGPGNPLGRVYSRPEIESLLSAFERHSFRVTKLAREDLAFRSQALLPLAQAVPARALSALGRRVGWNLYCTCSRPRL